MTLVSKSFSEIVTFSRSSNATRVGPTGLVEYAPHNLLLQSQTFDNASWTKNATSVVANAATAPDGTVTADKLIADATTANHSTYQSISFTGSTTYTFSVYAKAGELSNVKFGRVTGTALPSLGAIYFNLLTGSVVGSAGAGWTNASIQSVGNGWYRCSISVVTTGTGSDGYLVFAVDSSGNTSYTGDGTSGIYLWGAQLAVGPYALDYTPTTSAAVYGPRFDYDPVTLAARGLLIEESRTNLVTYSAQFDNAAWVAQAVTVTANTGVAPDGTTTADKIAADNTSSPHALYNASALTLTAAVHTWSIFVKAAGNNFANLTAVSPNGGARYAIAVDLTNGTVTQTASSGTPTNTSSFVSNYGNGWYRIGISMTAASSSNSYFVVMGIPTGTPTRDSSSLDPLYTGNNTDGILVWGAQLEAGSFATSYIPTPTNSTVTRSADVASVNTLSPWWNGTEGTFLFDFNQVGTTAIGVIGDDTFNNSLRFNISNMARGAGAGFANLVTLGTSQNGSHKLAVAMKVNDYAGSFDGGAVSTQTTASMVPASTVLGIGRDYGTTGYMNGWMRRIAYYPRRLLNAELQALTA